MARMVTQWWTGAVEPQRVHIVGASGSGSTTLGRSLANSWAVPHADVDDYFWEPTEPPYETKRDPASRLELMQAVFVPRSGWVLSGSMMGWGDALIPYLDAVVFVTLEPSERLDRLRRREWRRYGNRIDDGGDRATSYAEFLDWAAGYDDPDFDGRNRVAHEHWLAGLPCPVLHLDGARPVEDLLAEIERWPSLEEDSPSGSSRTR
jgi:adenylate kinase family enzyme